MLCQKVSMIFLRVANKVALYCEKANVANVKLCRSVCLHIMNKFRI